MKLAVGTKVSFQYRQHHILGGALVTGEGVVADWTIVGNQEAYVIKPSNGDTVHVRFSGVRAL